MEFKQKEGGNVPTTTTTTKTAVATSKKNAGSKESAAVWLNFTVLLETKKGIRKLSSGVAADQLFKKVFGDEFKAELEALSEEQISNIISKISFDGLSINIVMPSETGSYKDNF